MTEGVVTASTALRISSRPKDRENNPYGRAPETSDYFLITADALSVSENSDCHRQP
jgi:hypothetical protein